MDKLACVRMGNQSGVQSLKGPFVFKDGSSLVRNILYIKVVVQRYCKRSVDWLFNSFQRRGADRRQHAVSQEYRAAMDVGGQRQHILDSAGC